MNSMSRAWLAALGVIAVVACSDEGSTDFFPEVAGVYTVEGQFDGADPSDLSFNGTITIEQESLETSLLSGTADLTIVTPTGTLPVHDAELLNADVNLVGDVAFSIEQGPVSWDFIGDKAGDVLAGTHHLTLGAESYTGTWSGQR
jgi:hypothetical protein